MNKVRLGIVGAGTISLRVLRHLVQPDVAERVSLTAICDPVPDRARGVAGKFGIGRWFSEYEALLECGQVDAVTIASPMDRRTLRRASLAQGIRLARVLGGLQAALSGGLACHERAEGESNGCLAWIQTMTK